MTLENIEKTYRLYTVKISRYFISRVAEGQPGLPGRPARPDF
jgi:hypothetical protein